jgi:hypothetical protein
VKRAKSAVPQGLLRLLAAWSLCALAAAQTTGDAGRVEIRTAITDPARAEAGIFFKLHEQALAWPFPGEVMAALAGNEALVRGWSADRLAREYMVAADGAASDAMTVDAVRASASGALGAVRNTVTMPDGNAIALPVARSYAMHLWLMRATAAARNAQGGPPQLARSYMLAVQGNCPMSAGPIAFAQRDFLVEGRRDGRLLLQGALGAQVAWFTALQTRYMMTAREGERLVEIRLPDEPSRLYRAALAAPALRLSGADRRGACEIALEPAP